MNLDLSFIYWAETLESVKSILTIIFILLIAAGLIIGIAGLVTWLSEEDKRAGKIAKNGVKIFSVGMLMVLATSFIPSPEYIYAMGIAENLSNNSQVIESTLDSTIEKIVDAAKDLSEMTEEDD